MVIDWKKKTKKKKKEKKQERIYGRKRIKRIAIILCLLQSVRLCPFLSISLSFLLSLSFLYEYHSIKVLSNSVVSLLHTRFFRFLCCLFLFFPLFFFSVVSVHTILSLSFLSLSSPNTMQNSVSKINLVCKSMCFVCISIV